MKAKERKMGKYNTREKLKYLKYRVDHDDTPPSEKLDILEFLAQHTGLFGNKLNFRIFLQELHKLTADIDTKPKEK